MFLSMVVSRRDSLELFVDVDMVVGRWPASALARLGRTTETWIGAPPGKVDEREMQSETTERGRKRSKGSQGL